MLRDEFNRWYPIIAWLDPANEYRPISKTHAEYEQQLTAERKDIQDAWVTASFTDASDLALHRYYRYHKDEIINITSQLEVFKDLWQPASDQYAMLNLLSDELQALIRFLDDHFFSYLNEAHEVLPAPPSSVQGIKLSLKLSVAELACLIKLFYEAGLFPASSVIDVIRFMTKYFQTKKRSQISPGNLSKEYYSISQKTAASCRDVLEKMIKQIDHQFFPLGLIGLAEILSQLI